MRVGGIKGSLFAAATAITTVFTTFPAQGSDLLPYSASISTQLLADAAGYDQPVTLRGITLEVRLRDGKWHGLEIMGASPCEYTSISGVALGRSHPLAGNTSGDCVIINGTSVSVSRSGEDVTLSFSPHGQENKIVLRLD